MHCKLLSTTVRTWENKKLKNLKKNQISTEKIAFLTSLSLLFSYIETVLPKFSPFFKLGLANTVIISALNFDFPSFFLLICAKTIISSLFGGTLLSPFFVISISQSFVSSFAMFFLNKLNVLTKKRFFSIYGISIFGASISSCIQVLLCSFYLGKGTFVFLTPMLIFGIFSGFFTAFLSEYLKISVNMDLLISKINNFQNNLEFQKLPESQKFTQKQKNCKKKERIEKINENHKLSKFLIFCFVFLSFSTFFVKNLFVLCFFLIFSFSFQIILGKKIKLLPHIILWIFVIFCAILVPNGEILIKIANFSITKGAVLSGIIKSLKLSVVASLSLSLCSMNFNIKKSVFFTKVMENFRFLMQNFNESDGNVFKKIKKTFEIE